MAYKGVEQQAIGFVIGKTAAAVGHKLSGRAAWSVDEVAQLSRWGGKSWPIARFFQDPAADPEPTLTLAKVRPYVAAKNANPDTTPRAKRALRLVQ